MAVQRMLAVLLFLTVLLPIRAGAAAAPQVTVNNTRQEIWENPAVQQNRLYLYDKNEREMASQYEKNALLTLLEYAGGTQAYECAQALNLVVDLYNRGVQVGYPLYTQEEIAADATRYEPMLYYFPGDEPGGKYLLVLAGKAGMNSGELQEGMATVWELHQMGYTVFLLHDRLWLDSGDNRPLEDIARAVEYITGHAAEFGVQAEDYAIVGYSSGGQLAGTFGTEKYGYAKYGLPKPGTLILAYPINNFAEYKVIYHAIMDPLELGWRHYLLSVSDAVTPDYPPVFHWYAKNDWVLDFLVKDWQSPALERALVKNGVPHEYHIFEEAGHGCGTGIGTDAEGWLADAVAFWEEQTGA